MNAKKILTLLILASAYALILFSFSRTVDYDLGWHLRFGRDIWQSDSYPYQDTYTWSYQGQTWYNHEWGGDWLYWLIYKNFGYFPLLILLSLPLFFAFVWCIKIFRPKIGLADAAIILLSIHALRHMLVGRLAMFMPLFVVIIWYFLENLPKQKNYYFWPLLFWLWSVLHGSWILGFVIISIYIGGNIINLFCQKYFPRWYHAGQWGKKEITTALVWSGISALAVLVNPYGWHIWKEVSTYIFAGYYKLYITEWVGSYVYPIFAESLIYMGITLPLAILAWFRKKITWPQIILYIAFWTAAFKYKRHALLFFLTAVPLLAVYANEIKQKFLAVEKNKKIFSNKKFFTPLIFLAIITAGLLLTLTVMNTKIIKDIWAEEKLLNDVGMPVEASKFLKEKIGEEKIAVFNEFNWGGYLEWTVPNALTYFNGRGCVSWMHSEKETMLEHYRKILLEAGGLKEIEAGPSRYIILQKTTDRHSGRPDFINRLIFTPNQFEKIFSNEPYHLRKMIDKNSDWKMIYDDNKAQIWERANRLAP